MTPAPRSFSGLKWVAVPLNDVLRQARDALEEFSASGERSVLGPAVADLHQACGVLEILCLFGAAQLAEEMRTCAVALRDGTLRHPEEVAEALMLALIQLPDYLEKLQSGSQDLPLLLLPAINDLRQSRGVEALSEPALQMAQLLRMDASNKSTATTGEPLRERVRRDRPQLLKALLSWLRDADSGAGLNVLSAVFGNLAQGAGHAPLLRGVLRTAQALVEGLREGSVSVDDQVKGLIGRLDRLIKPLAEVGSATVLTPLPAEEWATLLRRVAAIQSQNPIICAVQTDYDLLHAFPSAEALALARQRLFAPGADALIGMRQAAVKELAPIKDSLDLFMRGGREQSAALLELVEPLRRLASSLELAGLNDLSHRLRLRTEDIRAISQGTAADDALLMRIAGDLLYVESSLENLDLDSNDASAGAAKPAALTSLPPGEMRLLLRRVLQEATLDLAKAKDALLTFLDQPGDTHPLEVTPLLLHGVAGALRMISHVQAADLLDQVGRFIRTTFIQCYQVPNAVALEALADGITGIEYYIEALIEERTATAAVLIFAQEALTRLQIREAARPVAERAMPVVSDAAADNSALPMPALEPPPAPPAAEGLDPEILEIFLEEAREALPVIQEFYHRWQRNPDDQEVLIGFRRAFHTLKGSGRLAGAVAIGEFSWSIERLLNRLLEQTLPHSDAVWEILAQALRLLPALIEAQALSLPAPAFDDLQRQVAQLLDAAVQVTLPLETVAAVIQVLPEPVTEPEALPAQEMVPATDWDQNTALATAQAEGLFIEDAELLEIFIVESQEHLETLQAFLAQARDATPPVAFGEEVVRALHTLAGSARMAGIEPPALIAKALERQAAPLLAQGYGADAEFLALLTRGVASISCLLQIVCEPGAPIPAYRELATEIEAYRLVRDELPPISDLTVAALDVATVDAPSERPVLESTSEPAETWFRSDEVTPAAAVVIAPEFATPTIAPAPEIILLANEATPAEAAVIVPGLAAPAEIPTLMQETYAVISGDRELHEIFLEEAQELLERLEESLRHLSTVPTDATHSQALQRTLHTLKGGARLAGLTAIGDLSHALETLFAGHAVTPEHLPLAQRALDQLVEQLEAVREQRPLPTGRAVLVALQGFGVASAPPVAVPAVIPVLDLPDEQEPLTGDADLQAIFLEEAQDLLEQLDTRLRGWQADPDDTQLPTQIKRVLHTLKGGARLAGIRAIGDLSHALETLLDGATPERLRQHAACLPLAQRAADRLSDQVDAVRRGGPVPRARPLLEELDYVHADLTGAAPKRTLPPSPVSTVADSPSADSATAKVVAPAPEQVRVRADLLNRMINNAGEISIYRARLEQQNSVLGFNLGELEQTVIRLHDQLRHMDIETEAQILYRYERERNTGEPAESQFDPLELDRFSTIQQLSRSLMETVNDLGSIRNLLLEQHKESETLLLQHSRISNDLQDGLLRTRMVPFIQLMPRLHRVVRQTAASLNKRATLVVFGAEGEMDRNILDRMVAPLEHILRNAVGHGIESPEKRRAAGKDEQGKIAVHLSREGNDVLIAVSDDGAGLNLEAIRRRAIENGLLKPGARVADTDLMQLILEPGFSTAKEVTQISGRGVGTDVVVSEVKQLGGSLEISSEPGLSTRFSIRLPFTLAITQALLVAFGDEIFAVPHHTMEGVVRISAADLARCHADVHARFHYAGHNYLVRHLAVLLGGARPDTLTGPLLLVRAGEHRVAIQVERIIGNRQIVMKSVGVQLSSVRWISGGTILGDGRVALILDVSALVRRDVVQTAQTTMPTRMTRALRVMVVDDSITVRKVTTRLLTRHNMEVFTAKDGVDAVAQLQEQLPDVMLLDIEMPRMDGYEVARHVRNSENLRHIPIIMITSRTGDKHRNLALSLGVRRYLGKPYQESDLIDNIHSVYAELETDA